MPAPAATLEAVHFLYAALFDDRSVRTQSGRLQRIVGHQDQCHVELPAQAADLGVQVRFDGNVEAGEGLVEQKRLRVQGECPAPRPSAAAAPPRKIGRSALGQVFNPADAQSRQSPLLPFAPPEPEPSKTKLNVLESSQVRPQSQVLKNQRQSSLVRRQFDLFGSRSMASFKPHLPGGWVFETRH